MDTQEFKPVTRETVFDVADDYLQQEARVPSIPSIRSYFITPTSPAIAVYFSEWRDSRADKIVHLRDTKEQWKAQAQRLVSQLDDISTRYKALSKEFQHFNQFIQANHPFVLTEWDDYRLEKE